MCNGLEIIEYDVLGHEFPFLNWYYTSIGLLPFASERNCLFAQSPVTKAINPLKC